MRRRNNRSSGVLITFILLLLIGGIGVLLLLNSRGKEENKVVVPTVPPTIIIQATSTRTPTQTSSPSPSPTVTQTAAPTLTPTAAPPSSTPAPTLIPSTPQPDLPALPAPVEIALGVTLYGDGIPPSYGRFGGLYDNIALINAGHIMLTVPGDSSLPTFHVDAFEVTNLQLVDFLNATALTDTPLTGWDDGARWLESPELKIDNGVWEVKNSQKVLIPVRGISALTARAYCANLGGSLPTLDQWNRAAFWVENAPLRPYPWGETPADRTLANFAGEVPQARDSMEKGRSFVGAFHMAGNVAEWVQIDDQTFGLIGGSFGDDAVSFETSLHQIKITDASHAPLEAGFRCVRQ